MLFFPANRDHLFCIISSKTPSRKRETIDNGDIDNQLVSTYVSRTKKQQHKTPINMRIGEKDCLLSLSQPTNSSKEIFKDLGNCTCRAQDVDGN